MITSKSTKAEILAAYTEAVNRPAVTWQDVPDLLTRTWRTISTEVPLFVKDCYELGCWLRRQANLVVEEFQRPVIRPNP
jgi:hypothetical protein